MEGNAAGLGQQIKVDRILDEIIPNSARLY